VKRTIELESSELNIIIHALFHKTFDKSNSSKAQKQYEQMYKRFMKLIEEGE
jgi:hypothetical protein